MEIFDPKYVHFTWDDSLKDKLVFYGDSVGEVKTEVEGCKLGSRDICCKYTADDSYPFDIKDVRDGIITHWQFVYYDPNYEVKVAYYKEGKQIQFKSHDVMDNKWGDCTVEPLWDDACDYRVKPDEPEKDVVPAAELPGLCGYCIHRKDGCAPLPAGKRLNCSNFFSTNDDYFRVKKEYDDSVKEYVELHRKYDALVSGIQNLMHKPVNC